MMQAPADTAPDGSQRPLAVMSTDIEGFSRIGRGIEFELLTSRLSRYFEVLGAAITANRGMIEKHIGHSIMAFWDAPRLDPDDIADACRAALQAAAASRSLAQKWRCRGGPTFRTCIGVHTGMAVVGNVGVCEQIDSILAGAVANHASRLKTLNKVYGTDILASAEVARATERHFVWRHVDRILVVGATEILEVYEPLGLCSDDRHESFLRRWKQGQEAYRDQRFVEAALHFEVAFELRPGDELCRIMLGRCQKLMTNGVPQNWDGTWHFGRK